MAITKRAGKKSQNAAKAPPPKRGPAGGVKKATFDVTKKKEVGVSDLTLLSKVSDEAINDNLKKRFEAGIIYVSFGFVEYDFEKLTRLILAMWYVCDTNDAERSLCSNA